MSTQSHIVGQGETLSSVAKRFGCTVSELQVLNPFINNANYIRAGWELIVPASPDTLTGDAASSKNTALSDPVVHFNDIAEDPKHGQVNFCGPQACTEDTHYYDIIYEVGQECFWLLREHTLDVLVKAADKLKKAVVTNDPDSRLKAMDDRGLMEFFIEPKLSSFLDAEKSQRYLTLESDLKNIKAEIEQIGSLETSSFGRNAPITPSVSGDELRALAEKKKSYTEKSKEKRALENEAHQQASKEGYRFEFGQLFSPEAVEAREIIELYLEQRQDLIDGKFPDFKQDEIDEFRKLHAQLQSDLSAEAFGPHTGYAQWVRESEGLFRYSEFTKTLMRAAAYGLALPEFALHKPEEDIVWGVKRYRDYHQLLKGKIYLEKSIQASFERWLAVGRQPPPDSLFQAERLQWQELESQEKALRFDAEANVSDRKPALHLIWEPENFQAAPEQRLVRSNFPLREVSIPTEQSHLGHFSFQDLRTSLGKEATARLKEDLAKIARKARKPTFDIGDGNLSDGDALDYWFNHVDARRLKVQDDWFDASGFFAPERFKASLETQNLYIENLRDEATFDEWCKSLRQMLFRKNPLGPLRVFDNSPQARLIRCLTPPQKNLHSGATAKGFQFSLSKGASSGFEAFLDVNLARGEVDLLKFELPKRIKATSVKAKYKNHKAEETEVDLGRFCLEGSIKAWGFAGATMLLGANMALKPSTSKNDVELDTSRDAQRGISRIAANGVSNVRADEVISANLNLFAGFQAGMKISGSLQWAPPKGLITARHVQPPNEFDTGAKDWLSVAALGANLSAAAGAGAKGEFSLSLQDGQIILRLKAALIAGIGADGEFSFVLGYKALVYFVDILNRELIKNKYHRLDWIMPEAFEYFTKAQVLRAVGVDLQWVFLLGYNKINSFHQAITAGQRSGAMAYSICKNKHDKALRQWFALLTPEGLGSMLGTLLHTPKEFEMVDYAIPTNNVKKYSVKDARSFQQNAIEVILRSIIENAEGKIFCAYGCGDPIASARRLFKKAMQRLIGSKQSSAFLSGVRRMDSFMSVEAQSAVMADEGFDVLTAYKDHRYVLSPDIEWQAQDSTFDDILRSFRL